MKQGRKFLLALLLVMIGGGIIGTFVRGVRGDEERIDLAANLLQDVLQQKPLSQRARERIWNTVEHHRVAVLGMESDAPLILPVCVKVDERGTMYVLDWGERKVKRFRNDGKFVRSYGLGAGKGPGEFSNPTDFDVSEDGSVWMCDPVNGAVTVFDSAGAVRSLVRPQSPPYRIALADSGRFVLMSLAAGENLFTLCDRRGTSLLSFGTFMRNQSRFGIALDGRIARSDASGFIYAGYRAGVVAIYETAPQRLRAYVETVTHGGLPRVVSRQEEGVEYIHLDPSIPLVTKSLSVVDGDLHLLAGSESFDGKSIVDVYDRVTGVYRYSYALPIRATSATITRDHLYSISDTTITIWMRETIHDGV